MTPDEAVAVLAAELDVVLPEELASLLYSGNDGIALDALTRNATGAPEWAEWAGRMDAYLGRRADGWATRTLWAVHEAYGRAGDLLSPDYIPGALERYGLLHVLKSATTADGKPDPLAALVLADDARMGLYAGELTALAKRVARELFAGARPDEAGSRETVTVNGRPMLRWDAGFADILEGLNGPRARELANDLRDVSADRSAKVPPLGGELWRLWARVEIGSGWGRRPRWMAALVDALWHDRWRPALEREQAAETERLRHLVPAYPPDTLKALVAVGSVWSIEPDADRLILLGRDGQPMGALLPDGVALGPASLPEAMSARELRSKDAHRFLLWFLRELRARIVAGESDFRVIRVPGRWAALAGLIHDAVPAGAAGPPDRVLLSRIVPLLGRLAIPGPTGTEAGNLYAYNPGAPAKGQRAGWFDLTAGTMLLPGALANRAKWDRATVPIPDLAPMEGVLTSRRNEEGQLATLRLLTVRWLQRAGSELVTEGGALLTGDDWLAGLNEVGLKAPIARADRLVDAWLTGGDDAPAYLVRVDGDLRSGRYHLHPENHRGARAYLDHGAEMSREGADKAKRAGRRRK